MFRADWCTFDGGVSPKWGLGVSPKWVSELGFRYVYDILAKVNLTFATSELVIGIMQRVVGMLANDKLSRGRTHLTTFCEMLQVVFHPDAAARLDTMAQHYKVGDCAVTVLRLCCDCAVTVL